MPLAIHVLATLTLLLAPGPALAQDPEPDGVQLRTAIDALRAGEPGQADFDAALPLLPQLIGSQSGWFVAGGAYLAGRHGRKACIPALLTAMEREQLGTNPPDRRAKSSILDALIRLEAEVPAPLLTRRLVCLPETYLLLARDIQGNRDALLELLDASRSSNLEYWAAACALVAVRDPRVAQRLLAGTRWEIDVMARDPGSPDSLHTSGHGARHMFSHEPWPPEIVYDLRLPAPGAELLPIRFERREGSRGVTPAGWMSDDACTGQRVRLLQVLLADAEERDLLRESEHLFIAWEGPEHFKRAGRTHFYDLRARLALVARRLQESGLLEDAEAVAGTIVLHVSVHDLRREHLPILPILPLQPGVEYH